MAYTTIDDPSAYFKVQLWTGNATNRSITFDDTDTNMQPDLIWLKNRDGTDWHDVTDSVRGVTKSIYPNETDAEDTVADAVTAFGSDGFSIGTNNQVNKNTDKYVAWCWKGAGGSGSADTNGTINTTSTSANTTSLFSISTYTGNNSNAQTIGHGLGVAPKVYIQKRRDDASAWGMYHGSLGTNKYLQLESTNAVATDTGIWNNTAPTSTVVSLGNAGYFNNVSSATYVSYAFGEVQGFSKFGKYTGNGNADGAFVYTGFRPAWIVVKRTDSANSWMMYDNKRNPINLVDNPLYAEGSDAEGTSSAASFDFLSNGFKCRGTGSAINASGATMIYMAFAEASFVNSKGVPCNAG